MTDEILSPNRIRWLQAEHNDGQLGGRGRSLFKLVEAQIDEIADGVSSEGKIYIRVVLSKHNIAFSQTFVENHPGLVILAQSKQYPSEGVKTS